MLEIILKTPVYLLSLWQFVPIWSLGPPTSTHSFHDTVLSGSDNISTFLSPGPTLDAHEGSLSNGFFTETINENYNSKLEMRFP